MANLTAVQSAVAFPLAAESKKQTLTPFLLNQGPGSVTRGGSFSIARIFRFR